MLYFVYDDDTIELVSINIQGETPFSIVENIETCITTWERERKKQVISIEFNYSVPSLPIETIKFLETRLAVKVKKADNRLNICSRNTPSELLNHFLAVVGTLAINTNTEKLDIGASKIKSDLYAKTEAQANALAGRLRDSCILVQFIAEQNGDISTKDVIRMMTAWHPAETKNILKEVYEIIFKENLKTPTNESYTELVKNPFKPVSQK